MWIYSGKQYEGTAEGKSELVRDMIENEDYPEDVFSEYLNDNFTPADVYYGMRDEGRWFQQRVNDGFEECLFYLADVGEDFGSAEWVDIYTGAVSIRLSVENSTTEDIAKALCALADSIRGSGVEGYHPIVVDDVKVECVAFEPKEESE